VPRRRWQSVSFLAALSPAGMIAGVAIPGAVDGEVLTTYLREALLPALAPGQVVVWDNLNVHKSARARRLIERAGHELCFLPRYSPDYNPIEPGFSKLKTGVRRAEPRSFEALIEALDVGMTAITPDDAAGFFAHAGIPLARPPL
jgi:transposase